MLVQVLDRFDPMPTWVRARVLERLSAALTDGYGPRALVRALETHYDPLGAAEGRHLEQLGHVLGLLAGDVKAGACVMCGQDPADGLLREVCDRCHPDAADVDPEALRRAVEQLGATP